MPFNKSEIIAQEYPELIPVYNEFLNVIKYNRNNYKSMTLE